MYIFDQLPITNRIASKISSSQLSHRTKATKIFFEVKEITRPRQKLFLCFPRRILNKRPPFPDSFPPLVLPPHALLFHARDSSHPLASGPGAQCASNVRPRNMVVELFVTVALAGLLVLVYLAFFWKINWIRVSKSVRA